MTSFSVIIPTHDRDDLLERAIESAASQSLKPQEIIVVDDMGRSQTKKCVESTGKKLKIKTIYLHNTLPERNALTSRNLAAQQAKGKYLAFLDDDDFWHKDYLKTAAEHIQKNRSYFIITAITKVDEDMNESPGKCPPQMYRKADYFLRNPGVLCSNVVVEKGAFNALGGFDVKVNGSADKDLFIQFKEKGYDHCVIEERLVYWLSHSSQWSNDKRRLFPQVVKFYRKYFWEMSLFTHMQMWVKLLRLRFNF